MMQRSLQIASRTEHAAIPPGTPGGVRATWATYRWSWAHPLTMSWPPRAVICTTARAGWDIIAACDDAVQSNALLVLGMTPVDLNAVLKREPVPAMDRWSSARTLNTHRAILGVLRGVSRNPLLDVQVFRSVPPGSGGAASGHMHHRLSTAARAFKQHALRSVQEPVPIVDPTETFRVRTISVV